jgi:hypothetical protein
MGKDKEDDAAGAAEARHRLVGLLTDYNRLQSSMAAMENIFFTHVVMPSYQLREAVRRREFLEAEYGRISGKINECGYAGRSEVEEDVRAVLNKADVEFSQKSLDEADLVPRGPTAGLPVVDHDFEPDEMERQRIVREFKRTVIPRVHADTSEAPFEEVQTVYAAYKKKDYLLLKAFIISYRGDLVREAGEAAEAFAGRAEKQARETREVLEKLERRTADLKRNMTALELEQQEKVVLQVKRQHQEILRAIYEEAEKISRLQELLDDLARAPFLVH